jgi:hypothetical protein
LFAKSGHLEANKSFVQPDDCHQLLLSENLLCHHCTRMQNNGDGRFIIDDSKCQFNGKRRIVKRIADSSTEDLFFFVCATPDDVEVFIT